MTQGARHSLAQLSSHRQRRSGGPSQLCGRLQLQRKSGQSSVVPSAFVPKCSRALPSAPKQVAAANGGQKRRSSQPRRRPNNRKVQVHSRGGGGFAPFFVRPFVRRGGQTFVTFVCAQPPQSFFASRVRATATATYFVADGRLGNDTTSTTSGRIEFPICSPGLGRLLLQTVSSGRLICAENAAQSGAAGAAHLPNDDANAFAKRVQREQTFLMCAKKKTYFFLSTTQTMKARSSNPSGQKSIELNADPHLEHILT